VGSRGFSRIKFLFAMALLAVVLFFARALWLPVFAALLIHDDGPAKADIAVVLGGDYSGARLTTAADLVRQGYVPAVLVSGPPGMYDVNEADAGIDYMVARGCPRDWFIAFHNGAMSTREESAVVLAELRRRNVHSFLLVTSNFHSARSRRIYLAAEHGAGPPFRTIAAPDKYFSTHGWWRYREGQKIVFFEWSKTVATAFGM